MNIEETINALFEAAEKDDRDAGLKAIAALIVFFMRNQDLQTKAMERVAAAMEPQIEILRASQ